MARKKREFSIATAVGKELGIDLGTGNTVIYMKGRGVVLREPSVMAVDIKTNDIVAVGKEAREMIGKNPQGISIVRPIQNGVVADFDAAVALLKAYMKKIPNSANTRARMVLSHPNYATEVEKIALEDVARHSGGTDINLVSAPLAALIGSGYTPMSPKARMVINMGAGHTEVCVCVFGEVVSSASERIGAMHVDRNIIRFLKLKYNLQISQVMAEEIKTKIGSVYYVPDAVQNFLEVKGRSVVDNLPKIISLHADEVRETMRASISVIQSLIVRACEELQPQIAADLFDTEILLTGGGAMLNGLKEYIEELSGFKVAVVDRSGDIVAEGIGVILKGKEDEV